MDDCIFCKIARNEIPAETTEYEGGDIIAFPDIKPIAPGHTLVIPRAHFQWFYDLPDDIADKLFRASRQIAKQLKEDTGADYIHLSIVGKDVPHVHVHLIPKKFPDALVM